MNPSITYHRKLAAVMFTDMVGFSALSQKNEALSLEVLEVQSRLVRSVLATYGGREIKNTGDGFLLLFDSALAAVRCASDIQKAVVETNASAPADRRFQLRIGIHLADVIHREADLVGDGVNIAARIEPLAAAGGICLSGAVVEQIRNKIPERVEKLESTILKNIDAKIDVYRLVLPWECASPNSRSTAFPNHHLSNLRLIAVAVVAAFILSPAAWYYVHRNNKPRSPNLATPPQIASTTVNISDQKSVAVLPFVNMSADKNNEYLSDGITEELLNALVKIPDLRVPARTSSFFFKGKNEDIKTIGAMLHVSTVLEGSIRKVGNRLRISAQLINVADGFHLWSEQYDRDLKNVFAIEDEITKAIVAKLSVTLGGAIPIKGRPQNIAAWELYLKGHAQIYKDNTEQSIRQALTYFRMALAKQPDYARAYAGIAFAYSNLEFFGYSSPQVAREQSYPAVVKALELDPTLAEAHTMFADKKCSEDDWTGAEEEYKRAIKLDPACLDAHVLYSEFLSAFLRHDEARSENLIAQRLDPLNVAVKSQVAWNLYREGKFDQVVLLCRSQKPIEHHLIGLALFQSGKRSEGIAEKERDKEHDPRIDPSLGRMYAQVGRRNEARTILRNLIEKKGYGPSEGLAAIYEGLGEFEQANAWMTKAIADHEPQLIYLKSYTDDLNRRNPYFPQWLKKIGLDK